MPVAYVLLVHTCPNHFARLVGALLAQKGAFVFVHVDRKVDIAPFLERVSNERVSFIEDRVRVQWGDFSMVEATLALMCAASGAPAAFERLCLLSGVDYPIRSAEYIGAFFSRHRGTEFINLLPVPDERAGKPISRFTRYMLPTRACGGLTARIQGVADRVVKRDYQRQLDGMVPCAGSQWWALTADACAYILEFVSTHPAYVRFFRHVFVPDEAFFQTIIGNSRFAPRVTKCLVTANWGRGASSPSVLDRDRVLSLVGTGPLIDEGVYGRGEVLFARKFPDDSAALVELLGS